MSERAMTSGCAKLLKEIPALRWLPGKSGGDGSVWLPTWIHLLDTAGVMDRLLSDWLPSSVIDASRLDQEDLSRACRFMALVHDIGKMTPLFAARIADKLPDIRRALEGCGISSLDKSICEQSRTCSSPHPLAGSAVLLSLGCPKSIAAVVGAHHGKPQPKNAAENQSTPSGSCAQNYYGHCPPGCKNCSDSPEGQLWYSIRRAWFGFALAASGYDAPDQLPRLNKPAQVLACGLLIMADWIASNTRYFPLISVEGYGGDMDLEARLESAMAELNLPDPWQSSRFAVTDADFEDEFGFAPNDIQRALTDAAAESGAGGIFILEAPMGCGKTEAALAAAEVLAAKNGCGGIFFGLPTQATANGIFGRAASWAEHQSEETLLAIRLAHGMAELNDEYRTMFRGEAVTNEDGEEGESGGLMVHSWFKGNKQALLANFVIGTVDQLLMAALKQKHMMLRHLGLAGKTVIIDECHAYDAYMNQYLDMAVRWLGAYRVPVIILSATLPSSRRTELIKAYLKSSGEASKSSSADKSWSTCRAYPLLTWTDGGDVKQEEIQFASDRRDVAIERISDGDMPDRVRCAVSAGGCAGVIVNTVARAQAIAKMLRDAVPEAEVVLFHSHFTMHDRAERERALLKRVGKDSTAKSRRGLVIVGTQVLEQSLDIDLDFLITDLCPMDLLLQRLGRLHRHSWRDRPDGLHEPRCALLGADGAELEAGGRRVYGDWPLLMTRRLLPDSVALPDDIADLIHNAYDDPDNEEDADLKKAHDDYKFSVTEKMRKAETYLLGAPPIRARETIDGMLETAVANSDDVGRAAVRDGIMSISVLVMVMHRDGIVRFLPWVHDGAQADAHGVPSGHDARRIAAQRMNLPYAFNVGGRYDDAVNELERMTARLPEWQKSPWLNGELLLLLDENMEAELCGFKLRYDREQGLVFETMQKGSDGDGC